MSSFSIRFHPLQEASYKGDAARHAAAAEPEEETKNTK